MEVSERPLEEVKLAIQAMHKDMTDRFSFLETRLGLAEKETEKTKQEIDELYSLIAKIGQKKGMSRPDGTAIPKEDVYETLEHNGYQRHKSLKRLAENGYIIRDTHDNGYTKSCRTDDGRYIRVIMLKSNGIRIEVGSE